ncbi:CRP/FNR family transcriptional regulator [Silvibacterium bohemicum]|uniref:CRP/FNR family transcriptional regulator n=2 Tax=Acidobacteriaceae TaxID=204434 RepID=A0A841JZG1_9BACT|nr:Crp/Fnr family transcriptional regulator [Silvibacterium bohemicum]MBB6143818.1 CRP/FNR family transcriptional regulator [Silvibacterium bohemicum]
MPSAARHSADKCADCSFRTLRLFCNLGDDAMRRLDEIGMHMALPGRAVVFKESQPAIGVFVVCEGQLKLSATSRDGRVMILRLAGGGDVLGLSAALNNMQYEVTAETLEPTILKSVRRADFLEFLQTYVEVGKNTSRVLAKEYHEVFLDARRLALSGSASGRLARLLLDWAATAACGKPELRFTMALTHEELANMAGTSRETVTRLLNQFERDKFIVRHGASIVILSADQLDLLAG